MYKQLSDRIYFTKNDYVIEWFLNPPPCVLYYQPWSKWNKWYSSFACGNFHWNSMVLCCTYSSSVFYLIYIALLGCILCCIVFILIGLFMLLSVWRYKRPVVDFTKINILKKKMQTRKLSYVTLSSQAIWIQFTKEGIVQNDRIQPFAIVESFNVF